MIAGTSMGAIIGAAYAAGLSGADLRAHVTHTLRNRAEVLSQAPAVADHRFLVPQIVGEEG